MVSSSVYHQLLEELAPAGAQLIAVSKFQPVEKIRALYELGHRDFGENYVQELADKAPQLPGDIRWHFIGHLQRNKVKFLAPFIHLIQSVDSYDLLAEIEKRAAGTGRVIDVLLEFRIATEETKHGLNETALIRLLDQLEAQAGAFSHVRICGLLAMASFTSDAAQVASEFTRAKTAFDHLKATYFFAKPWFNTLSMGMSGDYLQAVQHGSTMVRIGTSLFGARPSSGDAQL